MQARLFAFAIAAAVFALDRVTKYLVEARFTAWDAYAVIPGFFNLIHTKNRGAAFSLFADAETEWRAFFLIGLSAAALVLIFVLLWRQEKDGLGGSRGARIGLSLIFGGALGNMYDRVVHGAVTDFVELYIGSFHWPAFNVADTAITVGAGLVILDMLRSRHEPHPR